MLTQILSRFRWRAGLTLTAVVLAIAALAVPARALDSTKVSIAHTPVVEAVAGDSLRLSAIVEQTCAATSICSPVTMAVTYRDVDDTVHTVTARGSDSASPQTLSVWIPGEHVRYPAFEYDVTAWVDENYIDTPEAQVLTQNRRVDARSPEAGHHTTNVYNLLRFRLALPDGQPAAGAAAWAIPTDAGETSDWHSVAAWSGRSAADGLVSIRVPSTDAVVAQRDEAENYVNVLITAFDGFPTAAAPGGIEVPGLGTRIATTVQLGTPALPATDPGLRDQVFELKPETRTVRSHGWGDEDVPPCPHTKEDMHRGEIRPCRKQIGPEIEDREVPVAPNVGAGKYFNSSFRYTASIATSSEIAVKVDGKWGGAEGSTKTEKSSRASNWAGMFPEQSNYRYEITWNWRRYRIMVCWRSDSTSEEDYMFCTQESDKEEYISPRLWTGSLRPSDYLNTYAFSPHDQYENYQEQGGGCPAQVGDAFEVDIATGKRTTYAANFGGDVGIVTLKAQTTYSKHDEINSVHHWTVNDVGRWPFGTRTHFLYVPTFMGGGCPSTNPDLAYTGWKYMAGGPGEIILPPTGRSNAA